MGDARQLEKDELKRALTNAQSIVWKDALNALRVKSTRDLLYTYDHGSMAADGAGVDAGITKLVTEAMRTTDNTSDADSAKAGSPVPTRSKGSLGPAVPAFETSSMDAAGITQ